LPLLAGNIPAVAAVSRHGVGCGVGPSRVRRQSHRSWVSIWTDAAAGLLRRKGWLMAWPGSALARPSWGENGSDGRTGWATGEHHRRQCQQQCG
jgi:hypothetical protein